MVVHSELLEALAEDIHVEAKREAQHLPYMQRPQGPGPYQPHQIARILWGDPFAVVLVPHEHMHGHADAYLGEADGHPRIFLRKGVSPPRGRFLVAHEIAHSMLRHMGWDTGGDDLEEARADYLGACILAPRSAYRAAVEEHNDDFHRLAARFLAPQSCMVLRYGEVTNRPVVLVEPKRITKRGTPVDPSMWMPDSKLAAWAWQGTTDTRVRRTYLTDTRGVALSRA